MKNIVLIGMPACGKSTVGVILAKEMGMAFVDTDILIQERENKLLQDIIDEKGNEYIRSAEKQVLLSLTCENTVISTGGSAVHYPVAMNFLREHGIIVYIRVSFETIDKRLHNLDTRGVIMESGETIKDIYDKRTPLYEKYADLTIDGDNLTVEKTVNAVKGAIIR